MLHTTGASSINSVSILYSLTLLGAEWSYSAGRCKEIWISRDCYINPEGEGMSQRSGLGGSRCTRSCAGGTPMHMWICMSTHSLSHPHTHTHTHTQIKECTQEMMRQWCRIISTPERFLVRAHGPSKLLIDFFVVHPVGVVCVHWCGWGCKYVWEVVCHRWYVIGE